VELRREATVQPTRWQPHPSRATLVTVQCDWKGHWRYPIWATPALIASASVGCLFACYRKRAELTAKTPARARPGLGGRKSVTRRQHQPLRTVEPVDEVSI